LALGTNQFSKYDSVCCNSSALVPDRSGLHVPPAPTPSDGSTSALEENALPFQQTDVRALPDLVKVNEEDQQRNAKKLKDFQESFVFLFGFILYGNLPENLRGDCVYSD
jgi:hypothetical protein